MNTFPRRFFPCLTAILLAFLLWLPYHPAAAITVAQATTAIDSPAGATVTKMEYWKYQLIKENWDGDIYYWFAEDDNGDPIYTVSAGASKWFVQSTTARTTTPAFGGACLYSPCKLDDGTVIIPDGAAARLYLKVRGPGALTFLYKTSCDDSDALTIYVDGELARNYSGYGDDMDWEEEQITIDGGPTTDGVFDHEIVFEYFKSEPSYEGSAKIPDGPRQSDFDTLAEYNEAKKYFHDRIWIDHVVWTPDEVDIVLSPNPNPINDEEPPTEAAIRGVFVDALTVNVLCNEEDFGYHLRYTTDGTTPTAGSALYVDETGIPLTSTCTVKAKVFDSIATGTPRPVVPEIMVTGTFQAKAATPSLAVDEAASTPDRVLCTAATTTPGATILYTLTTDAAPDQPWPEDGLTVTSPSTIRAVARRPDTLDSDLASLTIIQTAQPVISAHVDGQPLPTRARAYTGANLTVQIASPSGAALYATATGPAAVWSVYTAPLAFNNSPGPVTILTRGASPGMLASAPVEATFFPANQDFTFGGIDGGFTLQDGWNLLGMPLSPTMETMTALLTAWPDVFAVDSATGTLCRPDWLAQGEGFWLYCDQATQRALKIHGAVVEDTVRPGWRLLTPALGAEPINAWRWSTAEGAYSPQNLAPGQGGWKYTQ